MLVAHGLGPITGVGVRWDIQQSWFALAISREQTFVPLSIEHLTSSWRWVCTCTSNYIFKSDYLFLSQTRNPTSKEFLIIQARSGEVLDLNAKCDTAIPQILNIGCQSARGVGLSYKFSDGKFKILSKIFRCS